MDSSLKSVSAAVPQVTSKMTDLGLAATNTRTAIAGIADAMPSWDGLDGLMSRLNTWLNADMTPDPMRDMPVLPRIYQNEQLLPNIPEHTSEVLKLREALSLGGPAQSKYGEDWGSGFMEQIMAHL